MHVQSYTRKDGTHISGHTRSLPGTASPKSHSSKSHSTTGHSSIAHSGPTHQVAPRSVSGSTINHSKSYCSTCPRDAHGKVARSEKAKEDFMRQTGHAHGRPGYVVDHIKSLACGGRDEPSNMQWQTVEQAKLKDNSERKGCS